MTAGPGEISGPVPARATAPTVALIRILPVAGGAYVLAGVAELTLGPAAPDHGVPIADVRAYYVTNTAGIALQTLLSDGLAALALMLLAWGFAHALAPRREARWIGRLGVAAAFVCVLQMLLVLMIDFPVLADTAAPSTTAAFRSAILYADSGTVVLVAGFTGAVSRVATRTAGLPRWLPLVGYLLVPLLLLGELSFFLDNARLGLVMDLAMGGLLVWAAAASWVISRRAPG